MEWTNHKHSLTGSLFKEIILFLHWWRNRLWQLGQGAHEAKGWESEDLNSNVGSASVSILGVLLYHVREPVQMGRGLSQLHYSLTLKGNGHHWPTDAVRQRRPTLLHWHTQTLKLALKMPPPHTRKWVITHMFAYHNRRRTSQTDGRKSLSWNGESQPSINCNILSEVLGLSV